MAFTHTKKVDTESYIKARIRNRIRSQTSGSGSDQKGPDPTGSGTLLMRHTFFRGNVPLGYESLRVKTTYRYLVKEKMVPVPLICR
jgi:hypothetical protein